MSVVVQNMDVSLAWPRVYTGDMSSTTSCRQGRGGAKEKGGESGRRKDRAVEIRVWLGREGGRGSAASQPAGGSSQLAPHSLLSTPFIPSTLKPPAAQPPSPQPHLFHLARAHTPAPTRVAPQPPAPVRPPPPPHLQDEETEQWREVQLAEERRQDAAVDLQVRLRDLRAAAAAGAGGAGASQRGTSAGGHGHRRVMPACRSQGRSPPGPIFTTVYHGWTNPLVDRFHA